MIIGRLLGAAAILTAVTGVLLSLPHITAGSAQTLPLALLTLLVLVLCSATLLLATYTPPHVIATQLLTAGALMLGATVFAVSLSERLLANPWPGNALSLALIAVALMFISLDRHLRIAQILLHIAGLTALIRLIGFTFGVEHSMFGPSQGVPVLTSVCIVMLWIGGLCALVPHGAVGTLLSNHVGARMARTLLPAAVLLPLLTTWMRLRWETLGLLTGAEGAMLAAVVNAAVLGAVILWTAGLLNRVEARQDVQAAELRRSEQHLRSMYEAPLFALASWGPEGQLLQANDTFLDTVGYSREELATGKLTWNRLSPPEETQLRERMSEIMYEQGKVGPFERELIHADGNRVPVLYGSVQLTEDPAGVSFVLDISELKQAREQLLQRNRELEASNAELDSFSYSVSHDLRAPLRAIEGFSKALEEDYGPQLDEEAQGYIDRVRGAALRMAQLIDDLLHLSRVSRADVDRAPLDISALAANVVNHLREAEPRHHVEVAIEPGMVASGDARLLRIALENLIGNAWKFSAGRNPARIQIGSEETQRGVTYFVSDNGVGFDMAFVDKLFTAFQRLHRVDQFAGTGIGLAIVRRIIVRHGGEAWAEAKPDQGAKFSFTLGPLRSDA